MTKLNKGTVLLIIAQLIFGISPVVLKSISFDLPESLLMVLRLVFTMGTFVVAIPLFKKYKEISSDIKPNIFLRLVLLGIIGGGIALTLFTISVRLIGAALTVVITRLEVPIGVIFAGLYLKEKVSKKARISTVLSAIGLLLIVYQPGLLSNWSESTFFHGFSAAIATAILWGFSSVIAKEAMNMGAKPFAVTFYRWGFGLLFNVFLVLLTVDHIPEIVSAISFVDWTKIFYLGVIVLGFGFYLYYRGMELITAHKTSILLSLSTVISILLGLATGEIVSLVQWTGIFITFYAVYMISTENH